MLEGDSSVLEGGNIPVDIRREERWIVDSGVLEGGNTPIDMRHEER